MQNAIENAAVKTNNASDALSADASVKVPEFCFSNFLLAAEKNSKTIKPSDKEKKIAAVEKLVEEGAELSKLHERYNDEYIVRGNKALYDVLASIYAYALRINESELKEQIVERMKKELKEKHGVKTTSQTPWLTTTVKFIVRTDRQTASNYSRVLQVAIDEDLAADELVAYIERRGGVAQIRETEADAQARKGSSETEKERLDLYGQLFSAAAYMSSASVKFDGDVVKYAKTKNGDADKDGASETGRFCHFLTVFDEITGEYRIVMAADFGKTFENTILKHMTNSYTADVEKIKAAVKQHAAANSDWLKEQRTSYRAAKAEEKAAA